jgi:transporter family-2 protein
MWPLLLLAAFAGAAIALQALINSRLTQFAGSPLLAATISFAVGLLGLALGMLTQSRSPHTLGNAPWWAWIGGLLGAFYILLSILLIPRIGVAALISSAVLGQMVFSLTADHFGLLGLQTRAASPARILGAALVLGGVFLIRK